MKNICLLLIFFSSVYLQGIAQEMNFLDGGLEKALETAGQENKPVFVDFYATWCGPCKQMARTVFTDPEVKAYYEGHFICVRVDVDKEKEVARKYAIQSMPTLLFLNSKKKELKRVVGMVSKERFLHIGQEICGEIPVYSELYEQYEKGKKDLATVQTLLLEAPDFAREQGREGMKWRERAFKLFQEYLSQRGLNEMINDKDFQILMLYHEKAERNDSVLNFINAHYKEFEKVVKEPHWVWEFILSRQNGLINTLAKAGDKAYLEELERIKGDMREIYAKMQHPTLSLPIYDIIKNQADGNYALYAEKDEHKFIELTESYFSQIGKLLSFSDYRGAIEQLVRARQGVLKKSSYEHCLRWLNQAAQLSLSAQEQLTLNCFMGNSFRGLDNFSEAKACYNRAYILAMQLNDAQMQYQLKAMLDQLPE